jgi:UV DNA damage endonuclease
MARSQKEYLVLRQLFSGNQWSEKKTEQFYQHLAEVKKLPINLNAQRNAYEHVWGYFKKSSYDRRKTTLFYIAKSDDRN